MYAQTYSAGGGSIPDAAPAVQFPLTVSGLSPAVIDGVHGLESVCINIHHTYDGDLSIVLEAPDGTHVDLCVGTGGGGDDFTNTCFNGNSPTLINSGGAPFTGTYRPTGILGSVNNSQNGNGIWKLLVTDMAGADTGGVDSWSLTFGNAPSLPFVFTNSNLPLVIINTHGQVIPDNPKIIAGMGIVDNASGVNAPTDPFNGYDGKIGIELRGSSSQSFPQKSYGFQTLDTAGLLEQNVSLLQMPAENDWILYAPWDDKTLIRNIISYKFANETGHYASRTKLCEVLINGQYQGVYVMMEKIKRDSRRVNMAKLNYTDVSGDAITGGYIFKIDKNTGTGGGQGWTSMYPPAVAASGQTILFQFHEPAFDTINPLQKTYIKNYTDSFETALKFLSLIDTVHGYRHFADVNSFIDYFILNEISKNVDGYRLSTFLTKDRNSRGGKIVAGPAWDFNLAWWNADYCAGSDTSGWAYRFGDVCSGDGFQVPFWWGKMLKDTLFTDSLHCKWARYRSSILDTSYLFHTIDSLSNYLQQAQARHFTVWPILGVYTWPNPSPLPTSYDGEINALKKWIRSRLAWLDDSLPGHGPCVMQDTSTPHPTDVPRFSSSSDVRIVPNPFQEYTHVQFSSALGEAEEVELFNVLGQCVMQFQIAKGARDLQIDAGSLKQGVYYLRFRQGHQSQVLLKSY